MPDPHLLPAFILAVTLLMLTPGPNVALIVSNSLAHGARRGMLTALATASASVAQLLLVSAGLTPLIARLGDGFGLLRWAGVAYLVIIGIQQWRAPPPQFSPTGDTPRWDLKSTFGRAAIVSILNPKTLLFYAAFFPQFVAPDRPVALQLAVLAAIYLTLAIIIDCLWAIGAGRLRSVASSTRLVNRLSGTVLIGAGVGLALQRSR